MSGIEVASVTVAVADNRTEAELIAGMLRSNGLGTVPSVMPT